MNNDDIEGATAFLYYFVDVANYTISQNDATALMDLCDSASEFCMAVQVDVEEALAAEWTHYGGRLEIVNLTSIEDILGDGRYFAEVEFQFGPGYYVDPDGMVVTDQDAGAFNALLIVERRDDGDWILHELGSTE